MKKVMLIVVSVLFLAACTPAAKTEGADSTAVAVDTAVVATDSVEVAN